jgi:NAD(P)-dependent dehydrogenase (short-subunit alcohol dehydrogenase family)
MSAVFEPGQWGVILGGSRGFGLATAQVLAEHGLNLCIVHRDRRSLLARIEPEFEKLRGLGVEVHSFNTDALATDKRTSILDSLTEVMGDGRVRVLLHSIAFGNLKLIAPLPPKSGADAATRLANSLGLDRDLTRVALDAAFADGIAPTYTIASSPEYSSKHLLTEEDFARTIFNMGTSLLGWVQELFDRKLFAVDARVFGLSSEGSQIAWRGYAAVGAAKVALESLARSIAVEYAPHGIRCNVIQAGITETPALAAIPGSDHLKAQARMRNPFDRLTTPRDVANVVYLFAREEAAWINGSVIRVDGGEHISGVFQ